MMIKAPRIGMICFLTTMLMSLPILVNAQAKREQNLIVVGENRLVEIGKAESPLVEPQITAHPTNPRHLLAGVIVASVPPFSDSQDCAAIVSFDAGRTWSRHNFGIKRCGDPWVTLRADGAAVFTALAGSGDNFVFYSSDGGRTWSKQPLSFGRGHDHPTLTVDTTSGKFAGSFYLLTDAGKRTKAGNPTWSIFLARSADGGKTFNPPTTYLPSNLNLNTLTPVIFSDGTVAVSYLDFQRNVDKFTEKGMLERRRAWMITSEDGGQNFSAPMFISEQCGGRGFPSLAVDAAAESKFRDRLYFVCIGREGDGVYLHSSADRGEKWSDPVRVNKNTEVNPFKRVPSIAVNKDSVIGISWYDRRNDPNRKCQDIYFAASLDGGQTFLPEVRVSSVASCPDTPRNGQVAQRWAAGGDYSGLVATSDGKFYVLWSDSRSGIYQLWIAPIEVKFDLKDNK